MSFGWIIIGLWFIFLTITIIRIFTRENRTPISRIAWIMVVASIPYIGAIIYYLFGEVSLGRHYNERLKRFNDKLTKYLKKPLGDWEVAKAKIRNPIHIKLFNYTRSLQFFEPSDGNRAELMPTPEATIENMIKDIDGAKQSVHGIYYIWLNDKTGTLFAQALMRAAKRGVKVRVLVDALGSKKFTHSDLWKEIKNAGVEIERALPFKSIFHALLFSRLDLRNHRKITVIDNKITYIGSRNIADPEFAVKAKYAPWVDLMVRMTGPIAEQNNFLFLSDWLMVRDENFEDLCQEKPPAKHKDGFVANVVPDGPTMRYGAIPQLFESLFLNAQKEIIITTPYFVPTEGIVDALCSASYSGIKTILILPHRNDSLIVQATSQSYYKEMLIAGVELREYKIGLLHSKTVTIDGEISMFGSSNLDRRSFDLNYENNVLIEDAQLTNAIRKRQFEYLENCKTITLDEVENWSFFIRLRNNLLAMLSPIL